MGSDIKKHLSGKALLQDHMKWLMLVLVIGLFLLLLYPNMIVRQHLYHLGDVAMQDIKAPRDFFVEDKTATAANQLQAAEQVLTVYDHDPRLLAQATEGVRVAFEKMRRVTAEMHPEPSAPGPAEASELQETPATIHQQNLEKALASHKDEFESMMGISVSRGAFHLLAGEGFSPAIADTLIAVVDNILSNGVVANKEVLLREIDKGITLRDVSTQNEKTVYALRQFYGPDQSKTMVRIVAEPLVRGLNYNLVNLIVDFSQRLVQPNITLNLNETEERRKQARADVKPIMYRVKTGEMLVREGERINPVQLLKLNALREQNEQKPVIASIAGAASLLSIILIVVYFLYLQLPRLSYLNTNKNLLCLAMALASVMVLAKAGMVLAANPNGVSAMAVPGSSVLFAMPIAACAMLVCLVLGFEIALPFAMVAAMCAALLTGNRLDLFLFFAITGSTAAYWVQHCRERKVVIMAGTKTGLIGALLAVAIGVHNTDFNGVGLVWLATLAFAGGLAGGIVTLGIAPLVEMTFGYTTDITLLELANLDRPILRRLMIEAPGTYHHSVVVGSMVEAAASEIGANPLLAKVCGYYHDIGKVKKPLYFIENQSGGRNKHDKLAPSMSSLILIAHVKDGMEIAHKQKLGQVIIDTIQQHHGTSLIHYFFEKAKQLKGEDAVKVDDFRYPGPKPQTKEVGLVMLADVVEAASRTLDNPTPARIQGLVQLLINKVFSDGQLDNCELTLKDLHSIAKSFNKILNGIHHHRIEYTESGAKEGGKVKNGGSDRQPAGKISSRDPGRGKESASHLRRLGQS